MDKKAPAATFALHKYLLFASVVQIIIFTDKNSAIMRTGHKISKKLPPGEHFRLYSM